MAMSDVNENEMQQELQQLANRHKQARIQAMIDKQDELRPIMNTDDDNNKTDVNNNDNNNNMYNAVQHLLIDINNVHTNPHIDIDDDDDDDDLNDIDAKSESKEISIEDEQAMKQQFNFYTKNELKRQITNQFDLRMPSSDDDDLINEKEENDMKKQFNLYSKDQINAQTQKQFDLRSPNQYVIEQQEKKKKEKLKKDQKELNRKYSAINKALLNYRSSNIVTNLTIDPKILPIHKIKWNNLCKDIGIINQNIVEKLWENIQNITNDNQNLTDIDTDDDYDHDDDYKDKYNDIVIKYKYLEDQIKKKDVIINNLTQRVDDGSIKQTQLIKVDDDDDVIVDRIIAQKSKALAEQTILENQELRDKMYILQEKIVGWQYNMDALRSKLKNQDHFILDIKKRNFEYKDILKLYGWGGPGYRGLSPAVKDAIRFKKNSLLVHGWLREYIIAPYGFDISFELKEFITHHYTLLGIGGNYEKAIEKRMKRGSRQRKNSIDTPDIFTQNESDTDYDDDDDDNDDDDDDELLLIS